jgi:hypothetical protein
MALASYYSRAALAASQVLSGFDPTFFQNQLEGTVVSIGFENPVGKTDAGLALLDMLVRLTARLYPAMRIESGEGSDAAVAGLRQLATRINPAIDLDTQSTSSIGVWVGQHPRPIASRLIYAGCNGFCSLVSTSAPFDVSPSSNPLTAGGAACIASANLFRMIFLGEAAEIDEKSSSVQMIDREASEYAWFDGHPAVLVGAGAIGNAFAWAFDRLGGGVLHLVDPERVELSNIQRYLLATPDDVARMKVDVIAEAFKSDSSVQRHATTWESFVSSKGYEWPVVAVAVDSARVRRRVQQSLPEWIANAWTQPGDLGVSTHTFEGAGACLACIYLPQGQTENEDAIVASQLRIPDQIMKVRELLFTGEGVKDDLLRLIAERFEVDLTQALSFAGRSIRELYTEGVCGGALIPLGSAGNPRAEVHVPLAHQSALAGLWLAASVSEHYASHHTDRSTVRRLNLMRRLPPTQQVLPIMKDPRGICVCQDPVYQRAFSSKYRQ